MDLIVGPFFVTLRFTACKMPWLVYNIQLVIDEAQTIGVCWPGGCRIVLILLTDLHANQIRSFTLDFTHILLLFCLARPRALIIPAANI